MVEILPPEKTAPLANVFIIDDDPDIVSLMMTLLSMAGYRVEVVTDPSKALQKDLPFKPDILLVDLQMPKLSGFELIEMLRDTCREQGIKIITVSALKGEEDIERAYQAGTDDYLAKPFAHEELLLRVRKQLEIQRAERTNAEERDTVELPVTTRLQVQRMTERLSSEAEPEERGRVLNF